MITYNQHHTAITIVYILQADSKGRVSELSVALLQTTAPLILTMIMNILIMMIMIIQISNNIIIIILIIIIIVILRIICCRVARLFDAVRRGPKALLPKVPI